MTYLLHIFPDSVGNPRKAFAGSTKDVIGRSEYFAERRLSVRELMSEQRSDAQVCRQLQTLDLSACGAVFFEYETYIESMRYLAEAHPRILRIVRAHNANLPHGGDQMRGRLRMLADGRCSVSSPFEDARQALQRYAQDRECAALADVLLPICEWEARHYWARLASAANVATLPYFVPRGLMHAPLTEEKRNLVVFMMGVGGAMTPLLYDAGRNAVELVNGLTAEALPDWRFAITGKIKPPDLLGASDRLQQTGLLESPLPLLAQARAVAILSDLGMGFKTKLLEAAMAGCWLLVTPDLLARLPAAIRPWCLAVEPSSVEQFEDALRQCEARTPPSEDPNLALRTEAFRTLDTVLARLLPAAGRSVIDRRQCAC